MHLTEYLLTSIFCGCLIAIGVYTLTRNRIAAIYFGAATVLFIVSIVGGITVNLARLPQ